MLWMVSTEGISDYIRKENFTEYLRHYDVMIQSKGLECPKKMITPNKSHLMKIRETKEYEIFEMVNERWPAKVTFHVPRWRCLCNYEYDDPAFTHKYGKNTKHTEDYLNYVVEAFIDEPLLLIETLSERYFVTEDAIESTVRAYRKRFEKLDIYYPHCQAIWLYQFEYRDSAHIIGFGLPFPSEENGWGEKQDLRLLGFCSPNLEAAETKFQFSSTYFAPEQLIVTTKKLYNSAKDKGYEVVREKFGSFPEPAQILCHFIRELEAQKKSYNLMTFLVWFQSRARREESRRQNLGKHLKGNTIMKMIVSDHFKEPKPKSASKKKRKVTKRVVYVNDVLERFYSSKMPKIQDKTIAPEIEVTNGLEANQINAYLEKDDGQIMFLIK